MIDGMRLELRGNRMDEAGFMMFSSVRWLQAPLRQLDNDKDYLYFCF